MLPIRYRESIAHLRANQLEGFFIGWASKPSPETHLAILRHSDHVVVAVLGTGKVVGFINALSDGILSAYIPLLEVLPEYRNLGIGSTLVRTMLEKLSSLYMIDVSCDPELEPFYERCGLEGGFGMRVRRYEAQSGARAETRPSTGSG